MSLVNTNAKSSPSYRQTKSNRMLEEAKSLFSDDMISIHRRNHRFHQKISRNNNDLFFPLKYILIVYTYTHTCVCDTCVCDPKYKLLSLGNITVCVFSGMSIWYWISNWCALPLPAFLFTCRFCVGLGL